MLLSLAKRLLVHGLVVLKVEIALIDFREVISDMPSPAVRILLLFIFKQLPHLVKLLADRDLGLRQAIRNDGHRQRLHVLHSRRQLRVCDRLASRDNI